MGTFAFQLSHAHLALGEGARRHEILQNATLEVDHGELVAIVGPSGSGKSTLLAVLAGLLPLDSGTLVLGERSNGNSPGIVFQDPLLLPWLDVTDNVALGLRYRRHRGRMGRRARTVRRGKARRMLDELGIGDLADRRPHELSGGQAQRVAIARTIVVEPDVVLLDEPFGALDPRARRDLQDWLLELRDRLALSIVLVTHDVDEALYLGDRIAVLSTGTGCLDVIESTARSRDASTNDTVRGEVLERLGVPLVAAST